MAASCDFSGCVVVTKRSLPFGQHDVVPRRRSWRRDVAIGHRADVPHQRAPRMHHEVTRDGHVGRRHLFPFQTEAGWVGAFELAAVEDVHANRCRRRRLALGAERTHERAEQDDGDNGHDGLDCSHRGASYLLPGLALSSRHEKALLPPRRLDRRGCGAARRSPPELRVINDAAEALGGRQKVLAVKTLTIEGEGPAPNVGQNTMPDGELPVWKVTEFKRTIDLREPPHADAAAADRAVPVREREHAAAEPGPRRRRRVQHRRRTARRRAPPRPRRAIAGSSCCSTRWSSCARCSTIRRRRSAVSASAGNQNDRRDRDGERREAHAGDRRRDEAAVARDVDEPTTPTWATSPSTRRFPATRPSNGLKLPKRLTTNIDKYPQFDLHGLEEHGRRRRRRSGGARCREGGAGSAASPPIRS